jgi:hypothetical protein
MKTVLDLAIQAAHNPTGDFISYKETIVGAADAYLRSP